MHVVCTRSTLTKIFSVDIKISAPKTRRMFPVPLEHDVYVPDTGECFPYPWNTTCFCPIPLVTFAMHASCILANHGLLLSLPPLGLLPSLSL